MELAGDVLPVRQGQFELPGCDPDKEVTVLVFDPRKQEGAVAQLAPQRDGAEPVIIQLAPCGSATLRLLDASGRPAPTPLPRFEILLRPRVSEPESIIRQVPARLTVPALRLSGTRFLHLDAQSGTLTWTGLIPGAPYIVALDEGDGPEVRARCTVQPGQTRILPDIVRKSPLGTVGKNPKKR